MDLNKFESNLDVVKAPGWAGDPVLNEGEVLSREKLLQRAKDGCKKAVKTLKAPPYELSELVLDGKKIV